MYIAKQNNLITNAAETIEELREKLALITDYEIEETDTNYIFNGTSWVTEDEAQINEYEAQIQDLKSSLNTLDIQTIRALRAILCEANSDEDLEKLTELEVEATQLRTQLQTLENSKSLFVETYLTKPETVNEDNNEISNNENPEEHEGAGNEEE